MHPTGYSLLHAGSGLGYGLSAVLTGSLISTTTPTVAMLTGAATTLVLTVITLVPATRSTVADENHEPDQDKDPAEK